jgi:hypothetical protein
VPRLRHAQNNTALSQIASSETRTERRVDPPSQARQNRRYALPHSASGRQGGFGNSPRFRRCSHGLGTGSPMLSREPRALTCTFGWTPRARTCDLRLRRGGDHALVRTRREGLHHARTADEPRDHPDLEEPGKRRLTSRFAWALRDSNPGLRLVRADGAFLKVLVNTSKRWLTCENAYLWQPSGTRVSRCVTDLRRTRGPSVII